MKSNFQTKMSSNLLKELREKSKKRKELLKHSLGKGGGHFDTFQGPILFCGYRPHLLRNFPAKSVGRWLPAPAIFGIANFVICTRFRLFGIDLQFFFSKILSLGFTVRTSYIAIFLSPGSKKISLKKN